jgi:hypothetical protein
MTRMMAKILATLRRIGRIDFIRVWNEGRALELTRGLRFTLDVEVGAAKIAANSGRESSCD